GSETPIYIEDPEKRRELLDWLKRQGVDEQGKPNVGVAAFVDPRYNLPVAYIYNKETGEGYFINYTVGQVQYMPDAKQYAESHMQSIWFSSLSPKELDQYIQSQQLEHFKQTSKREFEKLPPVIREIVGTLVTAGKYVFVPDVLTLKGALVGDKDPLFKAKKFHAMVEGIGEVSPITSHAGTALGIGTIVGGAAANILARGAAKLAAQGAKAAAKDTAKLTAVKKPELTAASTAQPLQQVVKQPTLLQTAVVGLKDAAVPMTISGAVFGGLEGAKSYIETGKIDASRVLEGAAFGSLMGAFPITKKQALAALGIGAGATAGAGLVRGYDLATSLAVGEAAGLTAVVGGGVKRTAEVSSAAKTPGARAPEVKIADFATVVKPEGRPAPRVDLPNVDLAKKLSSAVGNVVTDVVAGRIAIEEANLRLGALRDAVPDKALFDRILQSYKTIKEPPKAPTLDFVTAAKKAAEIISTVESGKTPEYRAFVELADLRASVADKARFDRLFGTKLKEYGEQYANWLLNSGLGKQSIALNLLKYESVLGRQFIERYVPDYGKVLAEVESRLAQLQPVSPRETPKVKLTPEDVFARVKSLFDDVVEGKKDWFRASEELYKMWRDASPEVRTELEVALNQLNRMYGEKYGVTLEPWRPPLLEKALRKAELFAADIKSAVKTAEEFLSPRHLAYWWSRTHLAKLEGKLYSIADSFSRGKIGLEEAKKALAKLADKYEKLGIEEMANTIREKLKDDEALKRFLKAAQGLREPSKLKTTPWAVALRLGRAKDAVVGALKETVPEHGRYTWKSWRYVEAERKLIDIINRFERGKIDLEAARREVSKLVKEVEKTHGRETAELLKRRFDLAVLEKEFHVVIARFRRGEISVEEARKRLMEVADEIEKKFGKERADFYRKYAEKVLTGKRAEPIAEEKPRLPDEGMFERNEKMMLRAELDRRGFEFGEVVDKFRRGEISRKEAERRLMQIVEEIEKLSDQLGDRRWADLYNRKYVEEVLSGKYGGPRRGAGERGADGRGQQQLLLLEKEEPVGTRARVEQILHSRGAAVTPLAKDMRRPAEVRQAPEVHQMLEPEVRRELVQVLRARAEAISETALSPELRHALTWAQETGQKLARLNKRFKSPRADKLLKEEPPRKRRKPIALLPLRKPETPTLIPPLPKPVAPEMLGYPQQYEVPTVSTFTPPLTADVPPTPTYTPLDVPQLTTYDVPTYYVPTVSTSDVPTYYVPTV
ncbi:MAG: hypothetical protein ACO2PN_19295, partial [Pyrobaculum sp.]